MSVAAEKVAEILTLPKEDRAFIARELLASLDDPKNEGDFESAWIEEIDRRTREIETGSVSCRTVEDTVEEIRADLHARRHPSRS